MRIANSFAAVDFFERGILVGAQFVIGKDRWKRVMEGKPVHRLDLCLLYSWHLRWAEDLGCGCKMYSIGPFGVCYGKH